MWTVPFRQVVDGAEPRAVLHRNCGVAGDRFFPLPQRFSIGQIEHLDQKILVHVARVQSQQIGGGLSALFLIEIESHSARRYRLAKPPSSKRRQPPAGLRNSASPRRGLTRTRTAHRVSGDHSTYIV